MSTGSNRGNIGVLPRTTKLADESYLEFIETFRVMNFVKMFPVFSQAGDQAVQEKIGKTDDSVPLNDIKDVIGELPITKSWQRFMRSHQEMMWRQTRSSFMRNEKQHLAELTEAESKGPGSLTYDPDFKVPSYARHEIHLQPGGYTDDPLGGIVFHYGTKTFYQGYNDQNEHHIEFVELCEPPADGTVERVLDVACSIGQCTVNLKRRFPKAEVTGLDVALPLLRYGHKFAVDNNIDVNFVQGLGEDTGYADEHFDMVFAYIMFHEVPVSIIRKVINEMFRILRPGGTFSIFEFPNLNQGLPPSQRYLIDYDSRNNCEPFSPGFVKSDFIGIIEEAGFSTKPGEVSTNAFLQTIIATKPDS